MARHTQKRSRRQFWGFSYARLFPSFNIRKGRMHFRPHLSSLPFFLFSLLFCCEPPTTEVAGFSPREPKDPRMRKMTPHPCTQRAPDGFPDRLTVACSCGRLGCAGGWGRHAGYPAVREAASASLYVARVTLVLFAASGTFAVTRDQSSFPRLDSRSRMR